MKTIYLNFHDILKIKINIEAKKFNNCFLNIFKHYENFIYNKPYEKYDLIINLGKFKIKPPQNIVYDNKHITIGENYIYVKKELYKNAKWCFEIFNFEDDNTILNINYNLLGGIFITGNIIEFIIQYKLLQKKYAAIHASGVLKNDSYIFASRGGGGKTTLALKFIEKGYNLLGDNYVILFHNKILSYPTSLSIFTYNISEKMYNLMNINEKISFNLKRILYFVTFHYAKFFTKINPNKVAKITNESVQKFLYFIIPVNNNVFLIEEFERDIISKHLTHNQMLEFPFFNKYISLYSYFFPEAFFSNYWVTYQNIISNYLKTSKNFIIYLNSNEFDNFIKKIAVD
jgi:hypothetical protein